MEEEPFDFVVIGGGPGGYVAAIRAAQLGLRTACVEKDRSLGGTCLNVGCIPSKALLDSTELFYQIQKKAHVHGIQVAEASMDVAAMMQRKEKVVSGLTKGIEHLFRKNGVEWIRGAGRLTGPDRLEVVDADGRGRAVIGRHVVVATGSVPAALRGVEIDEDRVLSSTGALALPEAPSHLIVVGGGVIGVELGSVWLRLGSRVTILELTASILPGMDADIAQAAESAFRKQGFDIRTGVRVTGIERRNGGVRVVLQDGEPLDGDRVLVAIGRVPYTQGLGLEGLGVRQDNRSAVQVNANFNTGVGRLSAIGDVIGGKMLAHKAMEEGVAVAEIAAGKPGRVDYEAVADVVYTWPEVASVGRSEQDLAAAGHDLRIGRFPFTASGRARAMDEAEGLVKVIADARTGRLLGLHIFGPRASDLISEASLAMAFEGAVEDIALTVHAHPTLPETLKEAALAAMGRAIHA